MNKHSTVKHSWNDRDVEAHWDRVADIYVEANGKVDEAHCQRFSETMKHLKTFPGMRILNVTSRDCEMDDFIHQREPEAEVIHAEISAGLMRVAAGIRPTVKQVKLESYSQLPFEDGKFDAVISLETLEHVAQPVQFLCELYRVAKPGAPLILSCPPHTSELSYRIFTALFGGHGEGPHRFPRSREVKLMFAETGWNLQEHYGTVLMPVGPWWWQGAWERLLRIFPRLLGEWGIRQFFIASKDKEK